MSKLGLADQTCFVQDWEGGSEAEQIEQQRCRLRAMAREGLGERHVCLDSCCPARLPNSPGMKPRVPLTAKLPAQANRSKRHPALWLPFDLDSISIIA